VPRVTVSARRKLDGPLAERYPFTPVNRPLLLLSVTIAVATAAALLWLAFR
jgi:hypothetical protein